MVDTVLNQTFIQNKWEYFRTHSDELLALAEASLELDNNNTLAYAPVVFDFGIDVELEFGTFVPPTPVPEVPDFVPLDFAAPVAPGISPLPEVVLAEAPVAPDVSAFTQFQLPADPGAAPAAPASLDQEVVLADVAFPEPGDYTMPELPTLYGLDLPAVPTINEIEFTAAHPEFTTEVPDNELAFTEELYSSTLLDTMKAKILEIVQSGTGLPAGVEIALYDAQRSRESMAARKLRQTTVKAFASRNMTEPNGVLARRLLEVEQDVHNQANVASREIYINRFTKELEQLNFAIQQGAALEGVLIQQNLAVNDRRLKFAQILQETAITIFNARVAKFNAEVQAYVADAEVYRTRIQGEMAKAEMYKAQIDGQKAIAEVNQTLVLSYSEQVKAVVGMVEVYKALVDAARARIENNKVLLETKRVQVETYGERIKAFATEWEGYKAAVEGKLGVVRAGEMLVSIYGAQVGAYRTTSEVAFRKSDNAIASEQLKLAQFASLMQQFAAQLQAAGFQNEVLARSFESESKVYESKARVLEIEANTKNNIASAKKDLAVARSEILLKNADGQVNQILKMLEVQRIGLNGKSATLAQLAASVLSGFNFGAQLSSSQADNISQERSASVSYRAGGPDITFAIGAI